MAGRRELKVNKDNLVWSGGTIFLVYIYSGVTQGSVLGPLLLMSYFSNLN